MTFNPMDLSGRAMLVTGASSGLGRATAIMLSRLGSRVFLLGRNTELLQQTHDALEGEGHGFLSFDLNRADEIPQMIADVVGKFSPLSGIAHFAGLMQTKPLQVCHASDFETLYRVNVVSATQILRGCTKPQIAASGGISVVLVGSVMSIVASPGLGAYAASKAGLLGLTRTAALELGRIKIRVNAILPGFVQTPGTDPSKHSMTPDQLQQLERKHPCGVGLPEDVAYAAAFLLSDASRWMTGSSLVVDGGYTAQ